VLPGERITLIKKIAAGLAGREPEDLRLTLRQFDVTYEAYYSDSFTIDPFVGVLRSIENAPDETLINLHSYLFGNAAPSRSERSSDSASAIWPKDYFRLFLTHTSAHKAEVGFLRDMLQIDGVSAFVAHADIEPTREWQDEIETALETCDALAAYMTPDFQESRWTDQEVGFCVGRAVLILPIKVGLDPYGFIGKYQALQGAGKEALALAEEIGDILIAHPLTASRMAGPAVARFAQSYSFDNARKNFARLQKVPATAWTGEMLETAERAVGENNQLSECVVPERIPLPDALEALLIPLRTQVQSA
jgi:hypothetical protein